MHTADAVGAADAADSTGEDAAPAAAAGPCTRAS